MIEETVEQSFTSIESPGPPDGLETKLSFRAKTSLRLKYEAESQMILKKLGGLDGIRLKLGLSQRKICQILMVDPSSWSRWMTDEAKTPPHILRACEWYLALVDKYPGFDVNFWLHSHGKHSGATLEKTQLLQENMMAESNRLKLQVNFLGQQILELSETLEKNLAKHKVPSRAHYYRWFIVGCCCGVTLLFLIYSAWFWLLKFLQIPG